ncbi:hypothetical protein BJY01DRAFT_76635 [Aspergillus pseudoustus]|uniref:Ankyrin repeat-containing domain protein n=1 Tax=Aspergillus pseudoustus TaxID=1810923 RepID=A0ABR4J6G6_9EURO
MGRRTKLCLVVCQKGDAVLACLLPGIGAQPDDDGQFFFEAAPGRHPQIVEMLLKSGASTTSLDTMKKGQLVAKRTSLVNYWARHPNGHTSCDLDSLNSNMERPRASGLAIPRIWSINRGLL